MRQAFVEADLHFQDWISNSKELTQAMKREKKPIRDKSDLLGTDNDQKKVLGAVWNFERTLYVSESTIWRKKKTPALALQAK